MNSMTLQITIYGEFPIQLKNLKEVMDWVFKDIVENRNQDNEERCYNYGQFYDVTLKCEWKI